MRPLSRREGVWIEPLKLDLPEGVVFLVEYCDAQMFQSPSETAETLVLAEDASADFIVWFGDVVEFHETVAESSAYSSDRVVARETADYTESASAQDSIAVTFTPAGALTITGALVNTAVVQETVATHFAGAASDVAIASETRASEDLPIGVADAVAAVESLALHLTMTAGSIDLLAVRDLADSGDMANTTDTVVAVEALAGSGAVTSPVMTDAVSADEAWSGLLTIYANVLKDTVTATEIATVHLALVGVLSDRVLVGDTLADSSYQLLVVVNAETGATSTYTVTPVVAGLADYRGTLYLAGPDGLYAMDATENEDGAVVWMLRTGFSDLGTDRFKRIQDLNVLARTEGTTTLRVVSDRSGVKQSCDYVLPPRVRTAYRDGVIKIGKGIHSAYFQFELAGTGPAEIDQLRLTVEPLSRRC